MAEKTKKPRLRFKGFTETWEQRKFNELYEKVSRKNDLSYGVNDIISVANMYYKPDSYVTDQDYLRTYNVFELGDIAFEGNKSKNFAHGRFVENTIGNGIVSHVFDVFKPKMSQYDLMYWKYAINSERLMGGILIRCTKASTMMTNLVANDFLQESFLIPSFEEQQRIGAILDKLDRLITLHQRKYDKFVAIKKALLEKMFPREGKNVPEIRFKGFTETWEQRELGDFATKVTEKNTQNSIKETFTNSAELGVISQRDYFDHDIAKADKIDGYYVVENDDFIYNPRISATAPCGPINRNKLGRKGVMSPLYTVFRTNNVNPLFLEWYFKSSSWYAYMYFNGDSGARSDRFSIKNELFFDMPIPMPKLAEQNCIGKLMDSVNDLITLHQRQLERLKNIKSALLEKMFV